MKSRDEQWNEHIMKSRDEIKKMSQRWNQRDEIKDEIKEMNNETNI